MSETVKPWSIATAKAQFSELVERARSEGPQTVTRNGREAVVVVSAEEWQRRKGRTVGLGDFLAHSPLRGSDIDLTRDPSPPRDIDLS